MFYSRRPFYGFTALASFTSLLICWLSRILQNKERELLATTPERACPQPVHTHKQRNFHLTEFSCGMPTAVQPWTFTCRQSMYSGEQRRSGVFVYLTCSRSSDLCSNGSWRPSPAREKGGSNLQKMAGRSFQWNHERSEVDLMSSGTLKLFLICCYYETWSTSSIHEGTQLHVSSYSWPLCPLVALKATVH